LHGQASGWLHLPHIGDDFGGRAIELAGIIVHPADQQRQLGLNLVKQLVAGQLPETIIAYTRNPAILKIIGQVSRTPDVLVQDNPEDFTRQFPETTIDAGIAYHLDRYAPDGLYGDFDPADRNYQGIALKQRAKLLENPNHALIVAARIDGGAL
jgi:hypothetical protein